MHVVCPKCDRKLKAKDDAVGKRARCPSCQHVFTVRAASAEPAGVDQSLPQWPSEEPELEAPTSEEILQAYKESSKRATGGVREGLKGAFRKVKSRARAVKLKGDVAKLRGALDDQMEKLGLLTVQHRPEEVNLGADLDELGKVQEEISEREATLESVRQTRGSGAVVKDLKRELTQLREQERSLMMGIGRKADGAKPSMPGAEGHYSAIERLRLTLESKEGELAELAEVAGPLPTEPVSEGRFALRKLFSSGVIMAAVVAGVVAVGLLAVLFFWFTKESYQVNYQVADWGGSVCMQVEVAGPAADLAVLLTEPGGKTYTETIDKVDMMDNTETVRLNMLHDYETILPGTYMLVLKTMEPEKVVYEEELSFEGPQVKIDQVTFSEPEKCLVGGAYGHYGKYVIKSLNVEISNTGDLPSAVRSVEVTMTGHTTVTRYERYPDQKTSKSVYEVVMPGERKALKVETSFWPGVFDEGTYMAKGKLYSAKDRFLSFEKEITIEGWPERTPHPPGRMRQRN